MRKYGSCETLMQKAEAELEKLIIKYQGHTLSKKYRICLELSRQTQIVIRRIISDAKNFPHLSFIPFLWNI